LGLQRPTVGGGSEADARLEEAEASPFLTIKQIKGLRPHYLGAQLDAGAFRHESFYSDAHGRIEMHLVSRRAQQIRIGTEVFHFEKDERLHTENSYKYSIEEFQALARDAGYDPHTVWTDAQQLFSVHYLRVAVA